MPGQIIILKLGRKGAINIQKLETNSWLLLLLHQEIDPTFQLRASKNSKFMCAFV